MKKSTEEKRQILENFIKKISNQKDMDPEIAQIVDAHFWEIVGENEAKTYHFR